MKIKGKHRKQKKNIQET